MFILFLREKSAHNIPLMSLICYYGISEEGGSLKGNFNGEEGKSSDKFFSLPKTDDWAKTLL